MYKFTVQTISSNETTIYYPGNVDYTVISAVLTYEIGLAGEFNLVIPVTNPAYNLIVQNAIITVYENNKEIWRGDIRDIKCNFDKSLSVYAVEDLAWLGEEPAALVSVTNETYGQRFNAAITAYNANQVAKRQFTVGQLTAQSGTCTWQPVYGDSILSALRAYIAKDKGYLKVRRAYSGNTLTRYIDIVTLADYGKQSTQKVEFGSNMIDFVKDMDATNICNAVTPYGAETETPLYGDTMQRIAGTPIQNDTSIAAYGRRAKTVVFDTDSTVTLNNLASSYLSRYSQPILTLEVKAADLGSVENVDSFAIGDSVRVLAEVYAVDQRMYITKIDVNCLDAAQTQITLSDVVRNTSLTTQVISQADEIKEIRTPESILEAAKRNAMAILEGDDGGTIIFVTNEDGQLTKQMFLNNLDVNQATKAWQWTLTGLAYMHRTYPTDDWTVGIAITMDGGIVADFITTGTLNAANVNVINLNASNITSGTLTVGGNGTNANISVKDALNNVIATINNTGISMSKGRIESANGYWFLDATTGEARLTSAFDYLETTANYSGAYVPLYNNSPASGWDSDTRKANIGNTFLNTSTGKCYQWQPYVNFQFHSGSHLDGTDTITFYYRDKDGQLWASESLRTANSIANKAYEIPIPSKDFWLRIVKNTGTTSSFGFAYTNLYSLTVTNIGWSKVTALPTVEDLYEVTSFPSYQGTSTVSSDRMWHITPSNTTYAWVEVGDTLKDAIKRIGSESFVTASHEEIFNKLTNNGAVQGLYSYNGAIYLGGQYIGAGEIAIGGSQYSDNPSLKIKDTNDDVVGTWTKDGIMANKGTFGILNIDAGTAPTYEDAKIYAEGIETFFQLNAATLSRSITKNIYFNPSEEGWTGEYIQIYMDFGSLNTGTGHDTTVCFNVHLYKLQSGLWTQLESRSFNFAGTELNGKSQFFDTEFVGSDDTDYKISIYVYKHNWQEDYYGVVNTTTFESFNISKNGIKGDLIGNIKGRADLTGLSIGRYNDIEYNKETGYLEVHTELLVGEETENVTVSSTDIEKLSGGVTTPVMWDTGSDVRLKEDISPIDIELSRDIIDGTKPKSFKYKFEDSGYHYGMIAQDVRELLDSVGEDDAMLERALGRSDEYRTINYEEYIPHIINYIKDLRAEITALKSALKKEDK